MKTWVLGSWLALACAAAGEGTDGPPENGSEPGPVAPGGGVLAPAVQGPSIGPTIDSSGPSSATGVQPAPEAQPVSELQPAPEVQAPGAQPPAAEPPTAETPTAIPHGACLDGITDFTSDGPFEVTQQTSGAIKFFVPGVPAGCKVPVIHLANGTGASCASYLPSLQRLATHGFLAACYESPNTGAGTQGLEALDTAFSEFPDLADNKFGSTGHSQGGQAAFTVLALAEKKYGDQLIYAALAMEPASGFGAQPPGTTWQALYRGIVSPVFMFSGLRTDGLVSQGWVQSAFDTTSDTVEAYFWTKNGATHIPVPNGEEQEISIPWFRWKLLGDQAACRAFKAIPQVNTAWNQEAVKNEQPCE